MSKDLIQKILESSNHIHNSSLRGGANFFITSPKFGSSLNSLFKNVKRIEKIKLILNRIKNG
jgi:hypothetical protein